ncbi:MULTISPECIES: type II secretion system protein [Pseudomonas]|nr:MULTISPECIES: type II secretion system protein [Pseudomonas]
MRRTRQKGFTLIEMAVVMAIISLMAYFLLPAINQRLQSAKIEAAVAQANNILQSCEMARRRVLTSTFDAANTVTHTYASIPSWSGTNVIENQVGAGLKLPRNNAFDNPILVMNDSRRCYVAVDIGFLLNNVGGYVTQTVNGNTRIIISARPKLGAGVDWVLRQKKLLSTESSR